MITPPRRLVSLAALAAVIGLAGGVAAYALVHLIALLTNLALFHRVGWDLPSLPRLHRSPLVVVVAVAGAMVVSLLARWSPAIRGHGIPEAMEAILTRQSRVAPRTAVAKPLSAAIAIGTGGPFGAEGPIIVTGGAIGSLVGQVIRVSPSERKILLASGAAAGMAATFGAPLASVVLAIELLLFEFSTRAFIPLVVAAGVAAGMHPLFFGTGPLFAVPHHDFAGLSKLPFYVVLGLLCGLLAVVITKGLFLIEDGFRRLPVSQFWWPAIGAVGFASIGVALPRVLGVGYDQISLVLAGRLGLALLAALAVAKLVAWWVALASGTSGGTLAPILLISGAFGAFLGQGAGRAFPWAHLSPGASALGAMAATFGAATRATFASIIFLFELTRDYNAILPLMLASVVADLVAAWAMDDGIMTEKLTRRGLRVASDYHADVLGTTRVRAVMTAPVETVHDRDTVATVASRFKFDGHGAYPIVDDDGRCVGIVARGDLLRLGWGDEEILGEVALGEVVSVSPDDLVIDALRLILEEQIDHVPVIAGDRLLGICTRTDILRARREQFAHEKPQPGWRPVRRRRSA